MAKVLIVDDSPTQLQGLRLIVERMGHQVVTADDGAHGVAVAKTEIPDLVLMDVVMPNLNGFQATRQISKDPKTSHIPVILVTTKDQETDKVWGMRQGAKAYITKPINEDQLVQTIQEILGGA
jgi:twitching motility two-component system response regulator PilH